jgi:hypothetical protein
MPNRLRFSVSFIAVAILTSVLLSGICIAQSRQSYKPKNGFVPNQETAIRIAGAVWIPIYGAEGVAEIEIAKYDGRIIRVSHGQ